MKRLLLCLIVGAMLLLVAACKFTSTAPGATVEQTDAAPEVVVLVTATTRVRSLVPTFTPTADTPMTQPDAASEVLATASPMPPADTPTELPVDTPVPTLAPTVEPTPLPPPPPTPALIQGGVINNALYMDTVTAAQINGLDAQFYPASNQVPAQYDVDRYQIYFQTLNESDEVVSVRAEIFFPRVSQWTAFPLFIYGSGTTGIASTCAPLDEVTRGRNWGNYRTHMLSYAAQGYIAVLPLWQGYDDATRTHPYFVARLEGYLMLDAARAAYNFFAAPLSPDILAQPLNAVFFGGYSQGGHGAFAADQYAPWYAPELPIRGIIGHATAPSVEALLRERPALGPYIVYAYSTYYGSYVIAPENVFLPQWLPTFTQDVTSKCVDDVYAYYPHQAAQIYRPEFLDALLSGQLTNNYAAFKQVLDLNEMGTSVNASTPALLIHGATDPVVTPQTNEAFMARMCSQGKRVTYYLYPDVNHFVTRQHGFVDTLNWMREILNGGVPPTNCPVVANPTSG